MKKLKRILALLSAISLLLLYLSTLILALIGSPKSIELLFISIAATVVIPVLLYVYKWLFDYMNKK